VAVLLPAPGVRASGDLDVPANAALTKKAKKEAAKITKALEKTVRSHAAATSKELKAIAKAAKTGKKIVTLSGVSPTPGMKVSPEQLEGLFEAALAAIARFHSATLGAIRDAYSDVSSNSILRELGSSGALIGEPGTVGSIPSQIADSCEGAWAKGAATTNKAGTKAQAALGKAGFPYTFTDNSPPGLVEPILESSPGSVLRYDAVVAAIVDCLNRVYVLQANSFGSAASGISSETVIFSPTGNGNELSPQHM
jgi:hypothetical protein